MIIIVYRLYIVMHLVITLLAVRSWPFTDYPMFSDPVYPEDKIFVYRYYLKDKKGDLHQLERSFAFGYGVGELNLSRLVREGKYEKLRIILKEWSNKLKNKDLYEAIIVKKVEALRPQETPLGELIVKEQEVVVVHFDSEGV